MDALLVPLWIDIRLDPEHYHAGGKFLKQNRNIYLLPVKNGILMGNNGMGSYMMVITKNRIPKT